MRHLRDIVRDHVRRGGDLDVRQVAGGRPGAGEGIVDKPVVDLCSLEGTPWKSPVRSDQAAGEMGREKHRLTPSPFPPFHSSRSTSRSIPLWLQIRSSAPANRRTGIFSSKDGNRPIDAGDLLFQRADPTEPWHSTQPVLCSVAWRAETTSGRC